MITKFNLKNLRLKMSKTQKEMAKFLNIPEGTYAVWESCNDIIPIKRLINICEQLKVPLDYILGFVEYKTMSQNFQLKKQSMRLKNFRKSENLTQSKLSKILNCTRTVITNYEANLYPISTSFLFAIGDKYKVSADYLLGRIDEPMYWDKSKKVPKDKMKNN